MLNVNCLNTIFDINRSTYLYLHVVRFSADVFFILSAPDVFREDFLAKCDDVLDKLVNLILILDLILVFRNGHQSWTKADSQVVRIHHVLVREFRQAV